MNKIAIVGAGGFVGTTLIESLVLGGHTGVRAVVRSYRNMAGFCRWGNAVEVRLADATRESALADAISGASAVVNVTTGPPAGIVQSTRAIYDACKRAGVPRFVHLSSAVVYGDVEQPIDDDAPPLDKHWMPYARAKAESERWLRAQTARVELVVLSPGIVWGVRSPHTLGFARAMARKASFLVDGGSGVFNGVYIANLVAMIRAACAGPKALTKPGYCLASPPGEPGKSNATTGTPKGSSRAPSCMVLPAPTIPLAPEITKAPRLPAGPKT
jgi:nucleoside-diphosphate-sugar epimerase